MAKKRKQIQTDFAQLERQPYNSLNSIGKLVTDAIVEISEGLRDGLGRRFKEEPTESQKALLDMVHEAFKELTPKQKRVLTLRYGLDGRDTYTLRETAEILGISFQAAHSLNSRALKALRKKSQINAKAIKKISEK